jgi:hypothetical protein
MRLACLLLAFLAAPSAATLIKIDNVDPTSLADSFDWSSTLVSNGEEFETPWGPFPEVGGVTKVTVRAEDVNPLTFELVQQGNGSWAGGLPADMFAVSNKGIDNIKLEFSSPISAFATYVDVSDHCQTRSAC